MDAADEPVEPIAGRKPREVIHVRDHYYVLATSALADDRTRVLKHGETFAVFDRYGDIHPVGHGQQGLYHESTRFLSRLEFRFDRDRPILLSSTVRDDNALVTVDLTNPDLDGDPARALRQDSVHVFRSIALSDGACFQRFRIRSFAGGPVRLALSITVDADFADIFEVRGVERQRWGERLAPAVADDRLRLGYAGLDGVTRWTVVRFEPRPTRVQRRRAKFEIALEPGGEATLTASVTCSQGEARATPLTYAEVVEAAGRQTARRETACSFETSNERFDAWIQRSTADLQMMITTTPDGPYPYAGVPWFNAPFGRDGLVTALETLWAAPEVTAGVLRFLAAAQATETSPEQDAEPGKIVHEMRTGEMAALGEVPFARYYGSVDATPLFVLVAAAYHERTGDRALIETLWPNLERALAWIDRYGDADGDGFVEYRRHSRTGLENQGWKDSHDAVFYADGRLAAPPIALCEVQAYVYGAKRGAAELADRLGHTDRARELRDQAEALRRQFEERFWAEDLGTYVLALDGEKQPCRVRSSNAGHCLLTGIASPERAERVARSLMSDDSFSGWGVRTISRSEIGYNPMSYHDGSVWPHDNAIIALGMSRYGLSKPVHRIFSGLFDASGFLDLHRLPELVCGFDRRQGEGPTLYPVACAPQVWATGALWALLQASLGLSVEGQRGRVVFRRPSLPPFLERVRVHELRVGSASVDLDLARHPNDVGIEVTRREGPVEVVVLK